MLAKCINGQWYFKVTTDAWVHIGPKLNHLELVLQARGIAPIR